MFFFIGGVGPRKKTIDRNLRICPDCGRPALYSKRIDHYLWIFFIPILRVKKGDPFLSCQACGASFEDESGR